VDPSVNVPEGLWTQRVESLLAFGADSNESMVVENPKVTRDPGLADTECRDEIAYRPLATAQVLDNAKSCRVRQRSEGQSRSVHGRDIRSSIYMQ